MDQVELSPDERSAIGDVVAILRERFPVTRVVLFGSKARGDSDAESDIDLLVLTSREVSSAEKDAIVDALFDTQLARRVVLSPLIVPEAQWKSALWRVMPIHGQIEREGVLV